MRYRVGNRYLSEKEYQQEVIESWAGLLFLGGCLVAGIGLHSLMPESWPKFIRFMVIILGGGATGFGLAYFARYIRELFFWCLGLGVVWIIGVLIWEAV